MKKLKICILVILIGLIGCKDKASIKIEIINSIGINIFDQIVTIKISELPNIDVQKLSAFDGNKEIPSQLVDVNADGKMDNFTFLVNLNANETKNISLSETTNKKIFPKRAHAEISEKVDYKLVDGVYTGGKFVSVKRTKTPEGHIDHNLYYKCEGPCWESDKVAYRFYIDQRNATDIFGKKVSEIILPNVGHTYDETGNEMYHTMQDWGMDILKVGSSLGMGSFAAFANGKVEMLTIRDSVICTIIDDGPIYASFNTKYYGWEFGEYKIDVDEDISIVAGSRLTKCNIDVSDNSVSYCTGFAKYPGTEFIKSEKKNGWNYIAQWGNQTSAHDSLGIAIFYNTDYSPYLTDDKLSYIVTFVPKDGNIQYCYAACWEQELDGVKTKDEFLKYLNREIMKLNEPIKVKIIK